jgi:hypothetical protein
MTLLLDPGALSLLHIGLHLGVTNQFALGCGVPSLFYLFRNLATVGSEPRLLFMEQSHGMLYVIATILPLHNGTPACTLLLANWTAQESFTDPKMLGGRVSNEWPALDGF